MRWLDKTLDRILLEAKLVDYVATKNLEYHIYYQDDFVAEEYYAPSEEQAIQDYIEDEGELLQDEAARYGITMEEFISGLRAKYPGRDYEQYTGFTPADIKSVNNAKVRQTIEDWLNQSPLPYKFSIIIGVEYYHKKPTPGVITYVKTGNSGGDVLTPFMILHTMGHALVNYNSEDISIQVSDLLESIVGDFGIDADAFVFALCKLLHTRAAIYTIKGSKRAYPTFDEVLYDLVAIYIIKGRITVKPNQYCDYDISQEACNTIRQMLEEFCRSILDKAVGTIVSDV